MFTRVLVEGLFGYHPDYPNAVVKIAPQFPKEWDSASISIPDYSLNFRTKDTLIIASILLSKKAAIDFYLPLAATGIQKVLTDGKPVKWQLLPGYGRPILYVHPSERSSAEINIYIKRRLEQREPILIEKNVQESFKLELPSATITAVNDLQKVLSIAIIKNGIMYGVVSNNKGNHTLILDISVGHTPQRQIIYIIISDKQNVMKPAQLIVSDITANAQWETININTSFNADVRTIYQQKYLSPRPNTVSVRIGTDGYSPWTFHFWKQYPPIIKLDSVSELLKDSNHILTRQHVPFIGKVLGKISYLILYGISGKKK